MKILNTLFFLAMVLLFCNFSTVQSILFKQRECKKNDEKQSNLKDDEFSTVQSILVKQRECKKNYEKQSNLKDDEECCSAKECKGGKCSLKQGSTRFPGLCASKK